jgi:hypothetical protein
VEFDTFPDEMMECFDFIEDQYVATNVVEQGIGIEFQIHPNPASEFIDLSIFNEAAVSDIYVTDMAGKIVLRPESSARTFDVSGLDAGIKFLVVEIDGAIQTKSFTISR